MSDHEQSTEPVWQVPPPLPESLAEYGSDVTLQAYQGILPSIEGYSQTIARVIQVLSRRRKRCPILISDDAALRKEIVLGVAHKIIEGNVPPVVGKFRIGLRNKQIVALNVDEILKDYAGRFPLITDAIRASEGRIIPYFDEGHKLLTFSRETRYLISHPVRLEGMCFFYGMSPAQYRDSFELDRPLEYSSQWIHVISDEELARQKTS